MKKAKLLSSKKLTAIFTASVLTVTACAATVPAAQSYQDAEKKALSSLIEQISEAYQASLDGYDINSLQGMTANVTLRVDDAGRSLLGLSVPVDMSWLSDVNILYNMSVADGLEGIDGGLYLNGTELCTFQMYVDMQNQMAYYCIPELSPSYLKASLAPSVTYEPADEDTAGDDAEMQELMEINEFYLNLYDKIMADPASALPEASVISNLLDTYGNKIIDSTIEGASGEEELSVEGISQSCMTYEGQIGEKEGTAIMQDILSTAREDASLKTLIETWTPAAVDGENPYEEFQKAIDEALSELPDTAEESDDAYLVSKIWVGEDDTIVGREFSMYEGLENSTPLFTWKAPSADDKQGLFLEINDGEDVISFSGSSEMTDGKANGTYHVSVNSQAAADIVMTDYDPAALEEGYLSGTYTITPSPDMASVTTEDGQTMQNPLVNFGLIIHGEGDSSSKTNLLELTVTIANAPIGALQINTGYGDKIEIPDLSSLSPVYDMNSEEDMTAYSAQIDTSSIIDKCIEAGVPEELANEFEISIEPSSEDESDGVSFDDETDAAA